MIQAKEALKISKQYQAIQEYINEIDKRIQAAATEGKTTCYYMVRSSIDIGNNKHCSCDVIANYLRQNGYKVLFRATYCIDILELEISWIDEEEEESNVTNG